MSVVKDCDLLNISKWPYHRRIVSAGTIQKWSDYDTKELFDQNCKISENFQKLKAFGWLDTEVEYKYNKQGFRSIEFDLTLSAGLALGCSYTEGIGIHNKDTWVSVLSNKIQHPIYNLGVGASAMDTVYRIAEYWIPVLKPKFVVMACPGKYRLEICDYNGNYRTYFPRIDTDSILYKEWIMNTENSNKNFAKNLSAIKYICSQYNIPIAYIIDTWEAMERDTSARDLSHAGANANFNFAMKMLEQMNGII